MNVTLRVFSNQMLEKRLLAEW